MDALPTPPGTAPPAGANHGAQDPHAPPTPPGVAPPAQAPAAAPAHAPQAGPALAPSAASNLLATLLTHIVGATSAKALEHTLRTFVPTSDAREASLAALLPGGQEPLGLLRPPMNTLGILYILSARLSERTLGPIDPAFIEGFCEHFDPEQARLAPERVTYLAKGIVRYAEAIHKPKFAVRPLKNLLVRFSPSLSYLTPLHPIFVTACLKTEHTAPALLDPILRAPISEISMALCPDLHYNDNLIYHYVGGCIFAQWKAWADAEDFFEICVSSPAQVPAALQLDALKKLLLVQCISKGKTTSVPRYTHPSLMRIIKNSPYGAWIRSYPRQFLQLRELLAKEDETFSTDRNIGLLRQALDAAPRWHVKRLTDTYITLSLPEIARSIGLADDSAARALVLDMIEKGEIYATMSAEGNVTFADAPTTISKASVDAVLRDAQTQASLLARLERDAGSSRDYLAKVLKSKDDERWATGGPMGMEMEEMMFGGAPGGWVEEAMFG